MQACREIDPTVERWDSDRTLGRVLLKLPFFESGVGEPFRAVANQLRAVSHDRIARALGHVLSEELHAIELAVFIQLDLPR